MTTQQAIEALHALPRLGQGAPGLARMQNLMDHLGNPEKDLQCIHIAGTNGKGSLAAMTSSILTAAGYKTGLTISPYVLDFRERFQIDGEMIPPRTLANLAQKVLDAIRAGRAIELIFADGEANPPRTFEPRQLVFDAFTLGWFVWGWDRRYNAERFHSLGLLAEINPVEGVGRAAQGPYPEGTPANRIGGWLGGEECARRLADPATRAAIVPLILEARDLDGEAAKGIEEVLAAWR